MKWSQSSGPWAWWVLHHLKAVMAVLFSSWWKRKWRLPTDYLLISALLELYVPGGLEYSLTTTTEGTCYFLQLKEYGLPVVFDKFAHGANCTSQQLQPHFMTIIPGDLKVEFVYINRRTGLPPQPAFGWWSNHQAHGPELWLHFTKKATVTWEKGLWHLPFWASTYSTSTLSFSKIVRPSSSRRNNFIPVFILYKMTGFGLTVPYRFIHQWFKHLHGFMSQSGSTE